MAYNNKTGFLGFYYVDKKYADYLREPEIGDKHIPMTDYEKGKKFFIGAVLLIDKYKYYAPVTSYKGQNDATFNIRNEHNEIISSVRLNYMFPVNDDVCKKVEINNFKDLNYKFLVFKEYQYCNKHKKEICEIAERMYEKRKNIEVYSDDKLYINNFAKLEKAAANYDATVKLNSQLDPLQTKYKLTDEQFATDKRQFDRYIKPNNVNGLTLEDIIRFKIIEDETGKYDPKIKAKVIKEVEDKQLKKELKPKYKLVDEQYETLKRVFDNIIKPNNENATLEKFIRRTIYMDTENAFDPVVKAMVTAEIDKAKLQKKEQSAPVKTQEKIVTDKPVAKKKRADDCK